MSMTTLDKISIGEKIFRTMAVDRFYEVGIAFLRE